MTPIQAAFPLYGIKEILGKNDNPIIVQIFNDLGFDGKALKDETAWCSAFMNFCHKTAGYEFTGSLAARSWLQIGDIVTEPSFGDVVIFYRGSKDSWTGHVGFWIANRGEGQVWTLGGNQGNMLQISPYPEERVLGYRSPKKAAKIP